MDVNTRWQTSADACEGFIPPDYHRNRRGQRSDSNHFSRHLWLHSALGLGAAVSHSSSLIRRLYCDTRMTT